MLERETCLCNVHPLNRQSVERCVEMEFAHVKGVDTPAWGWRQSMKGI
jgi:hypothetical protein